LEAGSIISSNYFDLKQIETPYSSLTQQFFNVSFAMLISSIPNKKRLQWVKFAVLVFIVVAILFSRRNLAVGLIVIFMFIHTGGHLSRRQIVLAALAVALLYFIGQVRSIGLVAYFSGSGNGQIVRDYYTSSSGGANIFMSLIGVIHLNTFGNLQGFEKIPFIYIFAGVNEGAIYQSHGYGYNGGMHLAATFYWSFGLVGVMVGGGLLGMVLKIVDKNLRKLNQIGLGSFAQAFSIVFTLLLSSMLWYGVLGIFKATLAIFFGFIIAQNIPKKAVRIS
jgi:hypothetical protein